MAITTKQHGNEVRITLNGAHFALLQRVADAMNGTTWGEPDNDPESVAREFLAWDLRDELDTPGQFASGIVYAIDTHAGNDAELEKARQDELMRVFEGAGLL